MHKLQYFIFIFITKHYNKLLALALFLCSISLQSFWGVHTLAKCAVEEINETTLSTTEVNNSTLKIIGLSLFLASVIAFIYFIPIIFPHNTNLDIRLDEITPPNILHISSENASTQVSDDIEISTLQIQEENSSLREQNLALVQQNISLQRNNTYYMSVYAKEQLNAEEMTQKVAVYRQEIFRLQKQLDQIQVVRPMTSVEYFIANQVSSYVNHQKEFNLYKEFFFLRPMLHPANLRIELEYTQMAMNFLCQRNDLPIYYPDILEKTSRYELWLSLCMKELIKQGHI